MVNRLVIRYCVKANVRIAVSPSSVSFSTLVWNWYRSVVALFIYFQRTVNQLAFKDVMFFPPIRSIYANQVKCQGDDRTILYLY